MNSDDNVSNPAPVNKVPPVIDMTGVKTGGTAFKGFRSGVDYVMDRAQTSQLKRSNGPFSSGSMGVLPNELMRLQVPDEARALWPAYLRTAPFMRNGAVVRVTGLWSREKLPFRCYPIEMPLEASLWLAKRGHQRGFHFQAEWLVKMTEEDQDKLFHKTATRMCYRFGVVEDEAPPVDPLAGFDPAVQARMRRLAATAAVPRSGARIDTSALDLLEAIRKCGGDRAVAPDELFDDLGEYEMAGVGHMREGDHSKWVKVDGGWVHPAIRGLFVTDLMGERGPAYMVNNGIGLAQRDFKEELLTLGWRVKHPDLSAAMFPGVETF